jgi:D-alanyl-D-alanine carboxypeptidase
LVVLENQSLDPADFARAVYYHDSLREIVIRVLSQNQKG